MGTSTTHVVCRHQVHIYNTSFAYLFWLANNNKVKYPEFCMGYIDETRCVGTDGHKYCPWGLSSPNAHICDPTAANEALCGKINFELWAKM